MSDFLESIKSGAVPGDVEQALAQSRAEKANTEAWQAKYADFDRQIEDLQSSRIPPESSPHIPWVWLLGGLTGGGLLALLFT